MWKNKAQWRHRDHVTIVALFYFLLWKILWVYLFAASICWSCERSLSCEIWGPKRVHAYTLEVVLLNIRITLRIALLALTHLLCGSVAIDGSSYCRTQVHILGLGTPHTHTRTCFVNKKAHEHTFTSWLVQAERVFNSWNCAIALSLSRCTSPMLLTCFDNAAFGSRWWVHTNLWLNSALHMRMFSW